MKTRKRSVSLFLALALVLCIGNAFAVEAPAVDENTVEICAVDPSLVEVAEPANLDNITYAESETDDQEIGRSATVPRVKPVYLRVYPLIYNESEGKLQYVNYSDTTWVQSPVSGANYIATSMTRAEQTSLIEATRAYGYEPIGWYVESAYNVDVYKAIRWTIRYWNEYGTEKGETTVMSAANGVKTFTSACLYPESTTVNYKCGMSGTLTYQHSAANPTIVDSPIELSVTFLQNR